MRPIKHLVVHCSTTPEGVEHTVKAIDRMHRQRGLRCIGFHYLVHLDGSLSDGRPEEQPGVHTEGHNSNSIAVAYVGGGSERDAQDTRTKDQKATLRYTVMHLRERFPGATVVGRRDLNRGVASPGFDVAEYADL